MAGAAEEDVDYPGPDGAPVLVGPVPNLATAAFPIVVAAREAAVPCWWRKPRQLRSCQDRGVDPPMIAKQSAQRRQSEADPSLLS